MTSVELPGERKSYRGAGRAVGDILMIVGAIYVGLTIGSWLGTALFKVMVLGAWRGIQDFGSGFVPWNIFQFLIRLLVLAPGLLLIWGADKLEAKAVRAGAYFRADDRRFRMPTIAGWAAGIVIFGLGAWVALMNPVPDPERFGVYACGGVECWDHQSGFDWAIEQQVSQVEQCAQDRSRSFREGCRYALRRQEFLEQ